jgi:hypothetical protein
MDEAREIEMYWLINEIVESNTLVAVDGTG